MGLKAKLTKLPSQLLIGLISIYQKTISPDHSWLRHLFGGAYCRYRPSCSVYAQQAISKYGLVKGVRLAWQRIRRCRPGKPGGWDPVD